jgi:hypothetical protein
MIIRPKFILYGAIIGFAGMIMISAWDERLKLLIMIGLFVVVAVVERRR